MEKKKYLNFLDKYLLVYCYLYITFSWSKGRQLDSLTKNGEIISYINHTDGMCL